MRVEDLHQSDTADRKLCRVREQARLSTHLEKILDRTHTARFRGSLRNKLHSTFSSAAALEAQARTKSRGQPDKMTIGRSSTCTQLWYSISKKSLEQAGSELPSVAGYWARHAERDAMMSRIASWRSRRCALPVLR